MKSTPVTRHTTLLAASLAALMMTLPGQAEFKQSPMLLKPHGKFIEISAGDFRRASSINHIDGDVTIRLMHRNKNFMPKMFSLSAKGIKELKAMDPAELEGVNVYATMMVKIDGIGKATASLQGEYDEAEWKKFVAAAEASVKQMETLLSLAENG